MPFAIERKLTQLFGLSLNADNGAGGGNDPEGNPAEPPISNEGNPKKLDITQEELDRIIAERIARTQKKFADYDELKTKLSEFEKAEEDRKKAQMSEQERIAAEKEAAEKRAQEAEEKAQSALDSANKRLIRSEFRLLAKELGIRNDALDDALILADLSAVSVDDEGNVQGAKEAVEALIANKPYLAEKKEPKHIGGATNPPDGSGQKTKEQLLKEAEQKAKTSGRIEDKIAYAQLKRELG